MLTLMQGKEQRSLVRRTSPVTTARTSEAERDRPGLHARLLPPFLSPTVSPGHPLSGDGRSIDYTRHTSMRGLPRVCAPFRAHSSPATGQGLRLDHVGPPEAITPRLYSPVASLGTPLSHGDGTEDTPDPLRTVESVWGTHPTLDSPVVPTGEPQPTSNGRESALPSLRMVERFPHTDRPQRVFPLVLSSSGSGAGRPSGPSALVDALPSPTLPSSVIPSPVGVPLVGTLPGAGPHTHLHPSFLCPPSSFLRRQEPRHTHLPPTPFTLVAHTTLPLRHSRAVGLEVRQGVNPGVERGRGGLPCTDPWCREKRWNFSLNNQSRA